MAYLSIIDTDNQYFKSSIGIENKLYSQEDTICTYNIIDDDVLVVEDTQLDKRFKDNQMIKNVPNIRFYAGAPISLDNDLRVGALCVIDNKPRKITDREKNLLTKLSDQANNIMESKRRTMELKQIRSDIAQIQELIKYCSWCSNVQNSNSNWVSLNGFIDSFNPSNFKYTICEKCKSTAMAELSNENNQLDI